MSFSNMVRPEGCWEGHHFLHFFSWTHCNYFYVGPFSHNQWHLVVLCHQKSHPASRKSDVNESDDYFLEHIADKENIIASDGKVKHNNCCHLLSMITGRIKMNKKCFLEIMWRVLFLSVTGCTWGWYWPPPPLFFFFLIYLLLGNKKIKGVIFHIGTACFGIVWFCFPCLVNKFSSWNRGNAHELYQVQTYIFIC